MKRHPFLLALFFIVIVVALASISSDQLRSDPEHVKPDHAAPPVAEASNPLPLAAVGGDLPDVTAWEEWVDGVARAEWFAGVEEAERDRQAALADLARRRAVRGNLGGVGSGDCAALAAEFGLPAWVLERESGCGRDNWNGSGCSGRGCIGPTQIDLGHFADVSPWGGPGGCRDLDPNVWADLVECTRRLSGGGSNLRPWGG